MSQSVRLSADNARLKDDAATMFQLAEAIPLDHAHGPPEPQDIVVVSLAIVGAVAV